MADEKNFSFNTVQITGPNDRVVPRSNNRIEFETKGQGRADNRCFMPIVPFPLKK